MISRVCKQNISVGYRVVSASVRRSAKSSLRSSIPLKSSPVITATRMYGMTKQNQENQQIFENGDVSGVNGVKSEQAKPINEELMSTRINEEARLPQNQEEYELYEDIYNLIQDRILPNIQEDGGNMEFRGYNFDNGTVFVKLTGACTSCSMSETTLKHGIENMLTYFIPEVSAVKQVFDPEEQIAISEFEKFEKSLRK